VVAHRGVLGRRPRVTGASDSRLWARPGRPRGSARRRASTAPPAGAGRGGRRRARRLHGGSRGAPRGRRAGGGGELPRCLCARRRRAVDGAGWRWGWVPRVSMQRRGGSLFMALAVWCVRCPPPARRVLPPSTLPEYSRSCVVRQRRPLRVR